MRILLILKKEWRKYLKYKLQLFLMLLLPVVTICLTLFLQTQIKPTLQLGIIASSVSEKDMVAALQSKLNTIEGIESYSANSSTRHADLMTGKYSAIITFTSPNHYDLQCLDLTTKDGLDTSIATYLENGDLSPFNKLLTKLGESSLSPEARSISFMFFMMLITATLFACNLHKEQAEGLLLRYTLAPSSSTVYLLGFFIFNLSIGFLQTLLASFILFVFGSSLALSPLTFLGLGLLISLICSSLAVFIVSITTSELSASALASSLALLLSLLGGAFIPLEKMPSLFKFASQFTLTKWLIELTNTITSSISNSSVFLPLIYLGGLCLLAFLLSLKISSSKFYNTK